MPKVDCHSSVVADNTASRCSLGAGELPSENATLDSGVRWNGVAPTELRRTEQRGEAGNQWESSNVDGDGAQQPQTGRPARSRGRLRIRPAPLMIGVIAVAAALWWFSHDSPRRMYDQARDLRATDPIQATRLLQQSVAASEGDFPAAQLLQTQMLAELGRWDDALGCFNSIKDPTACEFERLLELAENAISVNARLLAQMALDAANRKEPGQERVLRVLISLAFDWGQHQVALGHCQQLADAAPDDPYPWLVRARIHHQTERVGPAIEAYRNALKRKPSDEESRQCHLQIAELSIIMGDTRTARLEVDQMLRRPNPSTAARLLHVSVLRFERKFAEAMLAVESVLADFPNDRNALMRRGVLQSDLGQFDLAVKDLSKVVRFEPHNRQAHYKLGRAYQALRMPDLAKRHLEKSRQLMEAMAEIIRLQNQVGLDPSSRESHFKIAELYEQTGRHELARQWRESGAAIPASD